MGNQPYDGSQQVVFQQYQPQAGQQYYPQQAPPPEPKSPVGLIVGIVVAVVVIIAVLAAVLYVMVAGMSGSSGTVTTPVGSLSCETLSSSSAMITFQAFQPTPQPADIRIYLTDEYGYSYQLVFPSQITSTTTSLTATGGLTATYTDYNPSGNRVNSGDYITIYGLDSATYYTVDIFYLPTDSLCALAGDTDFTTSY